MSKTSVLAATAPPLRRHRERMAKRGLKRIEVLAPEADAATLKAVAAALRKGGPQADALRQVVASEASEGRPPARSLLDLPECALSPELETVFEEALRRDRSPLHPPIEL
jgi:hypothetical protein